MANVVNPQLLGASTVFTKALITQLLSGTPVDIKGGKFITTFNDQYVVDG